MKNESFCLLSLVVFFSCIALSQTPQAARIALTHVTVIDMTDAPPKHDMTVIIQGDRIAVIESSSNKHLPRNAQIINAHGKYLIPGLWDMHTHNFFGSNQSFYSLYIANGVTGIRDMGGEWQYYDAFEKERREGQPINGQWPAPRIVAAGVILDGKPPIHRSDLVVTNPEEARQAVNLCKGRGVDFIKVYNMLNRPSYFAIAEEAKRDGLPFAGHVPFDVSAAEASDAGQKSIEHSDGILLASSTRERQLRDQLLEGVQGEKFGEAQYKLANRINASAAENYSDQKASELFARFVRNGTWVTPTLVVEKRLLLGEKSATVDQLSARYVPHMAHGFWKILDQEMKSATPAETASNRKLYAKYFALVGTMHRAGVPLLSGTDTTNPYLVPGFSLHEELVLLVRAGLSSMEALQTATINPARFLGRQQDLGTVEEGKLADLVLLDSDPLSDIRNTEQIDAVVVNGRFLNKGALQKMLLDVAAMNTK